MRRLLKLIRTPFLYFAALLLATGYPVIAMADTPVAAPTSTSSESQPAPPKPTYTYNAATGRWDSNTWRYNPTTGAYEAVPAAPPPTPVPTPAPSQVSPVTSPDPAATTPATSATANPSTTPDPSSSTTGTSSTGATTSTGATNQTTAGATTGDATVSSNTSAGGATTGDATSTTTLLNNVNSVISAPDNQKVANFTYNVMGDVNGDIMLYPLLLKSMLESGSAGTASGSTTVAATQNNTLTNNVNLQSTSGNATVSNNTSAGDATTGSANTVANVMNILNSMISANRSFIGTINIYGNLQGDILIAPDFIPQMLASNQGGQQASAAQQATVQTNDTQTIVNNVSLAAKSGTAAVLDNTSAGNATSGSANTNVVIFNLSGHAIVAKDSLLVFVNVLGKWVGVIVDAPTGATSAMIGNGVVSNDVTKPDLTVTAKTTNAITNNITLSSQSGDATVTKNTLAGNATSGDATASANIANISDSQLGLSDWFGVLFINVFSNWYGSFGINTPYGDPPSSTVAEAGSSTPLSRPGVITFVPRTAQKNAPVHKVTLIDSQQLAQSAPVDDAAVLGTTTGNDPSSSGTTTTPHPAAVVTNDYRLPIVIGSIFVVGLSGLALRRLLASKP